MAYVAQDSRPDERGFEYPPLPNAYIDPYSIFNAYGGSQARASKHLAGPHPSSYPYHEYQAMLSSTAPPRDFSSPDIRLEVPVLRQIAPAPSPASSLDPESTTSSAFTDHTLSPADATKTKFVPYSAEACHRKRARGTTGSVVCDKCGYKFTVASSLYRHNKTCHGEKRAKKSTPKQRKTIKTKNTSSASDHIISALPAIKTRPVPSEEQSQGVELDSDLHAMSATSIVVKNSSDENAGLMLGQNTLNFDSQKPISTQSYVPRGPDTSADHKSFFCDLCPGTFARRDILQLHKARTHGLTEIPYLPDSGTIDRPPYLTGVTPNNGSKHSRQALKTFEGGGLSTSPCQPCILKGLECIVNPFTSSRCSYCNHRDSGIYCGAAGVKYMKPRGTADYPEVNAAKQNNWFREGYGAGLRAKGTNHLVSSMEGNIAWSPNTFSNTSPHYSNEYPALPN